LEVKEKKEALHKIRRIYKEGFVPYVPDPAEKEQAAKNVQELIDEEEKEKEEKRKRERQERADRERHELAKQKREEIGKELDKLKGKDEKDPKLKQEGNDGNKKVRLALSMIHPRNV